MDQLGWYDDEGGSSGGGDCSGSACIEMAFSGGSNLDRGPADPDTGQIDAALAFARATNAGRPAAEFAAMMTVQILSMGIVPPAGRVVKLPGGPGSLRQIGLAAKNYVYRALSSSDDIASGLSARAPGAGNSPISHVAGKRASEWISATKNPAIAVQKYGKNGVVRIDLGKVGSRVEDVSGGFSKGGRMSNWARADQEVLIQNHVPAEAITPFNFSLIP